jgi:hypothetical protein
MVIRFLLEDRVVTFPTGQLRQWEHMLGEPEFLTVSAGGDTIVIEGSGLEAIRAALDFGRLAEVRANRELSGRPGPRIREITLEQA